MKNVLFAFATLAVLCVAATGLGKGGHGGGHHGGGHHGGGHHSGHHSSHHAHHSSHHGNHDHHHTHHHTGHHSGYHNGAWAGHHNGWHSWHRGNWGGWGSYPAIWGSGAGLGWAANNYTYRNPFWSDAYAGNVNYAQPIMTSSYMADAPGTSQVAGTAVPGSNLLADNDDSTDADDQEDSDSDDNDSDASPNANNVADNGSDADDNDSDDADSDDDSIGPDDNQKKALAHIDAGRDAFHAGNYAEAQKLAEQAITLFPEDVAAHEFRALTLFAQKKYRESAAATYAVLAGGPGWNDETLMSFYPDRKQYNEQLADLQKYVKQNPKAADAEFLLAYHQLTAGHRDLARAELEQVAKLEPTDKLTAELIKALDAKPTTVTD